MTNVPKAYREADVRGASAVRLVVLLYEQIVRDLTQAAQAIEQNDIELRTRCINHAILVSGICSRRWILAKEARSPKISTSFITLCGKA